MRTLVIAPHPDDESLGCAGLLLRRKAENASLAWVIATQSAPHNHLSLRDKEVEEVSRLLAFQEVHKLGYETTRLDSVPMADLVAKISEIIGIFQPNEVLVPHYSDVHSDHRIISEATMSSVKWFRSPSISRVMAYETLSETNFNLVKTNQFIPNYYVDISEYLNEKIRVLNVYASEIGTHPFPRSIIAAESLAKFRGSACGFQAAEAFELLIERV